jgi:hypothetical protein
MRLIKLLFSCGLLPTVVPLDKTTCAAFATEIFLDMLEIDDGGFVYPDKIAIPQQFFILMDRLRGTDELPVR